MENGDQPATRSDLLRLENRLDSMKQDIDMLRSEVNHQYADLVERMSDGQTELLKAFYSYA
jgi:hypothetical protein